MGHSRENFGALLKSIIGNLKSIIGSGLFWLWWESFIVLISKHKTVPLEQLIHAINNSIVPGNSLSSKHTAEIQLARHAAHYTGVLLHLLFCKWLQHKIKISCICMHSFLVLLTTNGWLLFLINVKYVLLYSLNSPTVQYSHR